MTRVQDRLLSSGSPAPRRDPRAFTIIELVLAVAITLILAVGIHQVFRLTTDTVGAGQAMASTVRDYRAVQGVMYADLASAVMPYAEGASALEDGPFFLIRSERMTMFRTRSDQLADRDGDPVTLDLDGNNQEGEASVPGEVVRTTDLSSRSHRLDRLMFFGRGLFTRQTGGDADSADGGPFAADMSSPEAFIWYGHLRLPDRTTSVSDARRFEPRKPGEIVSPATIAQPQPHNASNFYAADWVLGRSVILLAPGVDTNGDGIGDRVYDRLGRPQVYLRRDRPLSDNTSLAPLHANFRGRRVESSDANGNWELESSRYDVANTSIAQYRQILARYDRRTGATGIDWAAWFAGMQFQADPTPDRPMTAAGAARTVPVFLPSCSSFLVEYAGDFVTQDADPIRGEPTPAEDGTVLEAKPDGVVDFVRLPDGSRQTRWYGLPRDTDGDGRVPGGRANNNEMPDVVPLRDVRRTAKSKPPRDEASFERLDGRVGGRPLPLPADGDYATSMPPDAVYVVAWGPDTADQPRPRMLRIVFSLDDPKGRLSVPQTYTYVVRLP